LWASVVATQSERQMCAVRDVAADVDLRDAVLEHAAAEHGRLRLVLPQERCTEPC